MDQMEPLPHPAAWRSLVAVCAHPDDESFGLGAVISALAAGGAATTVLSLTHGEASTLGAGTLGAGTLGAGTTAAGPGDLGAVRSREITEAATALGARSVALLDYPDGGLDSVPLEELTDLVADLAVRARADGLLVFDEGGITGHPDHRRATRAALEAGSRLRIPVVAWVIPEVVAARLNEEFGTRFLGRPPTEADLVLEVDRAVQRRAIACHVSQSTENPVLWRRLELLGDREWLRWLLPPPGVRTSVDRSGHPHSRQVSGIPPSEGPPSTPSV